MGLLYALPVSKEETDFVLVEPNKMTLKSYGLPYIFWGYAIAIFIMIAFMFLAIKAPIFKLISLGDETDTMLAYSLLGFIGLLPVVLFAFFFFEKRIILNKEQIFIEYRIYGIKAFSESFTPKDKNSLEVKAFLDSPNVARIRGGEESVGFQNKGYFILWLTTDKDQRIQLDRSSRKADLIKLQELMTEFRNGN